GLVAGKRPLPAHQPIIGRAGSFVAMAGDAFRGVHGFSLLRSTTSWWQADAVWTDADVPCGNFLRRCSPSAVWSFCRQRNGQRHGMRKRVSALGSTGDCNAAFAQLLPPSAETSTLVILP